jgi:DNA-binding transcriptional regulator GbsR (MarR family)
MENKVNFDEVIKKMKRDYFWREEEMFKSFHATEMERLKKEIDTNRIISIVWASIAVFLSAMALTVALGS